LASIIDGLSGNLNFPCNYVDPNDPTATTSCAFSNDVINQFIGPGGLPLENCTFGQCLSQYDLEQDWAASSQAAANAKASHLSGSVQAGLAVLGVAVAALLAVFVWGYLLLRAARKKPRVYDTKPLGLSWDNISYRVKSGSSRTASILSRRHKRRQSFDNSDVTEMKTLGRIEGNSSSTSLNGDRVILDSVSCRAAPGCLTMIIGASGAGKSSLLDILAGRFKTGAVQGQLYYLSDEAVDVQASNKARRQVAVVDQDDSACLPGYMTVRECLLFAAELSNPETVPYNERINLVDSVLETLGLSSIAGSKIGDARTRGISGGERRRVSLGIALVARPKILLLDEPTSGLDAYSAHRVMSALRSLASGGETGTTIIATLHQPSSEVFQLADSIILMDHGNVVYEGSPADATHFLEANGSPVPMGYNIADSLLSFAFQRRGPSLRKEQSSPKTIAEPLVMTSLPFHHGGDRPITCFMTQLHALVFRNWIMIRRDLSGPLTHIVGASIVSVFTGGCFYQVKLDIAGFQNRVGSIFFINILILFASLSALTGLSKVRLLMMRERANGFYSPWSWLSSHLVYDLGLLRLIPSLIIGSIVYWMVGLNHSPSLFFQFLLIVVVFNWAVSIYQMLLAAIFEEVSTAILYGGLFILFNLAFAGFFLNLNNVPPVIRWLKWICPSKYALEAISSQQLKDLLVIDNVGGVPISSSVSLFSFKLFGFQDNSYYRDLIVLACGFLLGFSLLLFGTVFWRMRERR
jgi:ABC-type multidrug transport system ATPase subunit/ABC-type multidrug transport system permease subunit